MNFNPHDYQDYAIRYIEKHPVAAVLLDMGLGKTIINRENLQWLIDESSFPFDFDMVIIDELSSFKNHKSKRFKSLMKVRPRIHRIIDLWAEFKVLDMGERLGRFITQYRTNYFMPDKRNGEIIYSYKPLPYAEDARAGFNGIRSTAF